MAHDHNSHGLPCIQLAPFHVGPGAAEVFDLHYVIPDIFLILGKLPLDKVFTESLRGIRMENSLLISAMFMVRFSVSGLKECLQ